MKRLKSFLIVTTEVKDAMLNYKYTYANDPEKVREVYMSYAAGDLDGNGLPKAGLNKTPKIVMEKVYDVSAIGPVELIDGRWLIDKETIKHLFGKFGRAHDAGGLIIDPNGTPRSLAKTDYFAVKDGDPLIAVVISKIKPAPEEV